MDRRMQHSVFHTIAFLAFSCLAISTLASWCCKFMSRIFYPCNMVPHFHVPQVHVSHFQRPRCKLKVTHQKAARTLHCSVYSNWLARGQHQTGAICNVYYCLDLSVHIICQCAVQCRQMWRCHDWFRKENNNNTYSNAFLSCYNASTLCFCTTLCQLTCRNYDHPTFWFYLF